MKALTLVFATVLFSLNASAATLEKANTVDLTNLQQQVKLEIKNTMANFKVKLAQPEKLLVAKTQRKHSKSARIQAVRVSE